MTLTRVTLATASSVLLLAALAACGGDSTGDTSADAGPQTSSEGGPNGGPGVFPGATGTVAAVSGSTAQVQNQQSGQVAVSWTKKTTFSQEVDGTLDDVAVGSCVVVGTSDASADASSAPTEVTASNVRISPAVADGQCQTLGPRGGGPNGQPPSGAPTDRPTDRATNAPGGARFGGFGTGGTVTATSATGFTVKTSDGDEVEVTVGADTTYTTSAKATAAAVKVGRCLMARGDSDSTGAVTASEITLSEPVDGQCGGGFQMRTQNGGAA